MTSSMTCDHVGGCRVAEDQGDSLTFPGDSLIIESKSEAAAGILSFLRSCFRLQKCLALVMVRIRKRIAENPVSDKVRNALPLV